jgi:hypothetical protein
MARAALWQDHGLVFPSSVGTPLSHRNVVRSFKAVLRRADLPGTIRLTTSGTRALRCCSAVTSTPSTSRSFAGTPPYHRPLTPTPTSCQAWTEG